MMGNFFETFYARGGRRSFRTAWTRSGHRPINFAVMHNGVFAPLMW
jgi:hypothetical protein